MTYSTNKAKNQIFFLIRQTDPSHLEKKVVVDNIEMTRTHSYQDVKIMASKYPLFEKVIQQISYIKILDMHSYKHRDNRGTFLLCVYRA